jgi:hypothetical protein
MKRRIVVDRGEVLAIARLIGCTRQMVGYSLNFNKNTVLAGKIGKIAIDRGGGDSSSALIVYSSRPEKYLRRWEEKYKASPEEIYKKRWQKKR